MLHVFYDICIQDPRKRGSHASHAMIKEVHLRTTLSKHRSAALPLWTQRVDARESATAQKKGTAGSRVQDHSRPLPDGKDVDPHAPIRIGLV